MKKRVLSMLLCLVLCCALLPTSVFAAKEMITRITEIEWTGIEAPVVGGSAREWSSLSTSIPNGANYNMGGNQTTGWKDETNGRAMSVGSKFEAGHTYSIAFNFYANDGYTFANLSAATLTNIPTDKYTFKRTYISDNLKIITVKWSFTLEGTAGGTISEVDVRNITTPRDGAYISKSGSVEYGNFTVADQFWYEGYDSNPLTASDRFEGGKTYYMRFILNADSGYVFSGNLSVLLDRSAATNCTIKYEGTTRVKLDFRYDVSGGNVISSVAVGGIRVPVGGNSALDEGSTGHTVPDGANYSLVQMTSSWYDENGTNVTSPMQKFVAGKTYSVLIGYKAKSGHRFADSVTASVTDATMANFRIESNTGTNLSVRYYFKATTAPTIVNSVTATVAALTTGKTPGDVAPMITSADSTLYSYDWFVDGSSMSKTYDTFEGGKAYTLKIRTSTTGQYSATVAATINGNNATVESWDTSSILFSAVFAVAATPGTVSSVGATVTPPEAGKSPTFSATLNPNTLTISNRQMGSSEYTENGVGWLDQTTGKYLKPSDTFQAGHSYQFSIGWLRPASGSKLAADGSGNVTATATVNGQSATISGSATYFIVNYTFPSLAAAKTLASIAVTKAPSKSSYLVGDTFDPAGMTVTATYSDGSKATVTGYAVTPNAALTKSDTSVTIHYTESSVTKTATQSITVKERTLASIAITKAPAKTEYIVGNSFDATGMVVTATYSDGFSAPVTGFTISPDGNLTEGHKSVTVSYTENYSKRHK